MRVLVTGAGGFIGGYLVSSLRERHEVIGLARTPAPERLRGTVQWVEHDLAGPIDRSRLPDRIDAVVHLAQSREYRNFPEGARDVFAVNVTSTLELLEYARLAGASCFVYASSGGVYGSSYERFVESDPVNPLNFYLSSKYAAELTIANYETFFRTIIFRFFFVYGPGQHGMLVSNLLERILAGDEITIEGDPGIRINPIYVEDAVSAFEPALEHPTSGVFNVGGDEVLTLTDLVRAIGEAADLTPTVRHVPAEPLGDLVGDTTRLRELLGVRCRTPLREGLRATIAAFVGAHG